MNNYILIIAFFILHQVNSMPQSNINGQPLDLCSSDPLTGWFRDGYCNVDSEDRGVHAVCAEVSYPIQ